MSSFKFVILDALSLGLIISNVNSLDSTELQSINELLMERLLMQNSIQRHVSPSGTFLNKIMNFSCSVVQLIGVTISLIASNILTPFFQSEHQNSIGVHAPIYQNSKMFPSRMCPYEYGCDQRVCWRSCGNGTKTDNSWCYTSAMAKSKETTYCSNPNDCSPCWACISVCHVPNV